MATPEMTAELERDMDEIAAGKIKRDDVLQISREMLHGTYDDLFAKREDLAKVIWAGMDEDKFIGPCKVCEEAGRKHEDGSPNRLRIIEMRGGKRFVGCEGYNRDDPEDPNACTFSRPLPGRGYELWRLEERCSICDETPRLKVKGFRGRPWNLCLNDECPSMVEMREKRAERQKAKEEAAEAQEAGGGDGTTSETNGRSRRQARAGARRRRPRRPGRSGRGAGPRLRPAPSRDPAAARPEPGRAGRRRVRHPRGSRRRRQEHPGATARPRRWGPETLLLREPGGTPAGERLRDAAQGRERSSSLRGPS